MGKKTLHEMTLDEIIDVGVRQTGNTRHVVEVSKLKRWQAAKVKNCYNKALVVIRPGEWAWEQCGSVDYYGLKAFCLACRARIRDYDLKEGDLSRGSSPLWNGLTTV
jgi:hypothetical protein